MNSEHVEVLRRMRNEWPLAADEGPALDAAIASLSAPQPPAEAQPVAWPMSEAEVRQWIGACNHEPSRQVLRDYLQLRTAPPSAPVGVELPPYRQPADPYTTAIPDEYARGWNDCRAAVASTLAQQPAADFDAWQQNPYTKVLMKSIDEDYVPKHDQQPEAVDEAMVERATMTLLGKSHDTAPGIDWRCDRAWTVNKVRKNMRAALTAALAAQQGGRSDD